MSGPHAMLSWHHNFHFGAGMGLRLPAKERVSSGLLERVPQGERTFSALGLTHRLTDRHRRAPTTESSQGASGYPSTGVEKLSNTRTVRSTFQCI